MPVTTIASMSVTMIALMPVPMIASMLHSLATIWARWATRMISVVKVHQQVAGFAAASVS
jgi:hypothetical protein